MVRRGSGDSASFSKSRAVQCALAGAPVYDVVIIGGGPAGATTAVRLSQAGWTVALVEKASFPRRKVCGEFLSATNLPLLEALGAGEEFDRQAGPPVERVGLFLGKHCVSAPMPVSAGVPNRFGRALGREWLDTLLLERARALGTEILQPFRATRVDFDGTGYRCRIAAESGSDVRIIFARIVVAAHGSWDAGSLPTQPPRQAARASDLFGFKGRFTGAALPTGLMPLLSFPGGYGGMVHTDADGVSVSCCIRRDQLGAIRQRHPQSRAAEAVIQHILESCQGVREALIGATLEGKWLTVGPIRPGIRVRPAGGVFLVGNAAGEAHPAIAEGISIAIQSGWLLSTILAGRRDEVLVEGRVDAAAKEYAQRWRFQFAGRVQVSALFAALAMRPELLGLLLPAIRRLPRLLTLCARESGKASYVSN